MTPLRVQPLRVGLATNCSTNATDCPLPSQDDYDARIMHRAVPATLETVTVLVDANDYQIARALRLDPRDVRTSWITSRTVVADPRPAAVQQCAPDNTMDRRYRAPMIPLRVLQEYRDMAVLLRQRLSTFVDSKSPTQQPKPVPQDTSPTVATLAPSSAGSVASSYEPTSVIFPTSGSKCCGFSDCGKRTCFRNHDERSVVRTKGGLYSGARQARLLSRGESVYTEFEFSSDTDLSGVAAGVALEDYGLDTMVGARPGSMAFHSEPKFVVGGTWNEPQRETKPLRSGDTLGVMVAVSKGRVVMRIAVNGVFVGEMFGDATMCTAVDNAAKVQVMVSMYRAGTNVRVKCCPAEWTHSPLKMWGRNLPALCAPRALARNNKHLAVAVDEMSAVLTP